MRTTTPLATLALGTSDSRPDVSIVVVSYNVCELLRACLRSIRASEGTFAYEVVVVDNCSRDRSADMVGSEFPEVRLIVNRVNGGYAQANNLGLREIRGRYVLLLNPDTELPRDALARVLAYADARPDVGAVGPKLVRQDGSLDLACRRSFPSPEVSLYRMLGLGRLFPRSRRFGRYNLTYLDPDVETEVDSVVGAFMFIRSETLRQIGLLDERFFMYGEDLDLAYRIKRRGWRIRYYPEVQVLHYKGESSKQEALRTRLEFFRAMLLFHRKHFWRRYPLAVNALVVAGIYSWATLSLASRLLGVGSWVLGVGGTRGRDESRPYG